MPIFTSPKYRQLTVKFSDGSRVKFHNGEVEVSADVAKRLDNFAATHPDYRIERAEDPEKPQTPKQRLQEQARALDLDDSGTVAELEARIADALDESDDEPEDDEPNGGTPENE